MKLSILFISLLLFAGCSLNSEQRDLVGHEAPNARYYLLDGSSHALSEHLGKTLVLAFWEASCHHCQQALPQIKDLAAVYAGTSDFQFLLININRQSEEEKVRTKIRQLGLGEMSNAFSGNDIYDESFMAFHGDSIPYLVLIDKQGIVNWLGNDVLELRNRIMSLKKSNA